MAIILRYSLTNNQNFTKMNKDTIINVLVALLIFKVLDKLFLDSAIDKIVPSNYDDYDDYDEN